MAQQPIGNDLLANVQGDILGGGMPKKTQLFFFFTIDNPQVQQFRVQLGRLLPLVTTAAGVLNDRNRIAQHKRGGSKSLIPLAEMNIAFSHTGLSKMGFNNNPGDKIAPEDPTSLFDKGMQADAGNLGDNLNNWIPEFISQIDGTVLVAGDSHESVQRELAGVKIILGHAVREVFTIQGDVRPGAESGHEHFGFLDGISNPAVEGVDSPLPGQDTIPQGIMLLGRPGDNDLTKNPPTPVPRPSWAKDGSFLCFRMLAQHVPEFDAFLTANAIRINDPSAPRDLGKELLGARMVGRWKSGAPIDLAPLHDDPALGADPNRNNNFNFTNDSDPPSRCPFASHIRKTNPRSDLNNPSKGLDPNKALVPHRIIRRGIAFGTEVTPEERASRRTQQSRGLLFVSYQASLANGFQFIQRTWANNPNFIFGHRQPPGWDSIIGQTTSGTGRSTSGLDPNNPTGPAMHMDPLWVISRGGEYLFSPSISGLRAMAGVGNGGGGGHGHGGGQGGGSYP